ncbi:MAG TPA: phosphoribosylamine--glycine ligase [Terriglobia bacterium]|nr:phosphoribosylamine--glycine ligase [Terriglobia bacterium]
MKILVIGSGGREHALTWKLRESLRMEEIYCAPGNAGIGQEAECLPVDVTSPSAILELANSLGADLTVIGPEAPLVAGVVDKFAHAGRAVIGPSGAAARLEGSKIFAKQFMGRHGIPTARFAATDSFEEALRALDGFTYPLVIKADGLAAGKGVVIAPGRAQAESAIDEFMRRKTLGDAGERIVIEECLSGEELSFIVLTDGRGIVELAPTQDHKRLFDGDQGPNTGGMGAYSEDSILNPAVRTEIIAEIVRPTLEGLRAENAPYRGFLYCGLMLTPEGPKVLEYNVRLGDPEAQPILMRLRSDFVDLLLAARDSHLESFEAHWTPNPAICVVAVSRGYPGKSDVGLEISGFGAAESIGGVKLFHAGTRVEHHRLLTAGGRVLGVTTAAEDLAAAVQRAYTALDKIHFEGMHYRHDIGVKGLTRPPATGSQERTPRPVTEAPRPAGEQAPAAPKFC